MPIIKSKSWKSSNFSGLIEYIHKHGWTERTFGYHHNIFNVKPGDLDALENVFVTNDAMRRERKNGNCLYHEWMSFSPSNGHFLQQNPDVLEEFARIYLELRAPNSLAYAYPHFDKQHIHVHFMISANQVASSKATRMTKREFEIIKEEIQEHLLRHYPEMKSYVQSRDQEKYKPKKQKRISSHEYQMNERGARSTKKEFLRDTITRALASTDNRKMFIEFLTAKGVLPYTYRGKFNGVMLDGQKKVRFSTLFSSNPEIRTSIESILESEPEQEQNKEKRSLSTSTLDVADNAEQWSDDTNEVETEGTYEDGVNDQDEIPASDAPNETSSDAIVEEQENSPIPPAPQGNPGVTQGGVDSRRIIPEQDDDLDIRR